MEYEIKPQHKITIGIRELWEYRELFYFFTWRDIKVKYKQTVLGFLWAIIQPLFMAFIFTSFLGDSISEKTNLSIPYPAFALSGMLLWGVFSGGVTNSANSMVSNSNIIKKIYFPRLIIPISAILVALFDFFIACTIFVALLFIYQMKINLLHIPHLFIGVFMTLVSAVGCGSLLASLNIKYRDVRYVVPFFIQGLMYLSPVIYPTNITSSNTLQFLLKLNPISGSLELMRSIFAGSVINYQIVIFSFISSFILFIIGIYYFRKTEAYFADLA